ncbi:MAG: ATPase [Candidatus Fluviicola riflensis]|nr:MAG: ATPase [Candidatus Fluviicola riflensis]OGS78868.1 MAG: ATPase [Candidatus Fluviicola riflensis]OGS85890.1 MAG: ATPase [Fluviicola sp. RIFCSPHIGHO2_12_FULL_43_24]OGS86299.1 MAG: ATPase [Fluviicola sp. RIFCSPHIGHO2_01_FULL_43_53]
MLNRIIVDNIRKRLSDRKVIVILGSRQVGKTTLFHQLFGDNHEVLWWNGDESDVRIALENTSSTKLKTLIGNHPIVVIDEAQRIDNIGLAAKLIYDTIPNVKVLLSGSSAFEIKNKTNEPLTGRKWEYQLFPFSFAEMVNHHGLLEERRMLEHRLVYGYYPEVVMQNADAKSSLAQITSSYLYKDILMLENIHKAEKLERLVQALAFQIGHQVSYNELSQTCGLDNQTVEKYIDLLEKSFVVFRIPSFSRNIRNELKKSRKIYFYDNGIRNAVIKQFNPLDLRNDEGALWENFLVSERMKYINYNFHYCNRYFWRTHAQQEIDYVEDKDGLLSAFEFKWNPKKAKAKMPKAFGEAYPNSEFKIIHRDNFYSFLGIDYE